MVRLDHHCVCLLQMPNLWYLESCAAACVVACVGDSPQPTGTSLSNVEAYKYTNKSALQLPLLDRSCNELFRLTRS